MSSPAEEARRVLERAVADGEVPGAAAALGDAERPPHLITCGVRRYGGEAVTGDTRYDLASLTKVVATLPALLKLVDDREIRLDDRVERFFSNAGWFQSPSLADATIEQLLTHTSGLPAWKPLFALVSKRDTAVANVLQTRLEHPAGTLLYSDLGFIVLGAVVERVTGMRLDHFVRSAVFEPLGMTATTFGPLKGVPVAATEECGWRNRLLAGEVHDENAYVMAGVAGHAGLFATAGDLASYARAWLNRDPRLASEALLTEATRERIASGDTRRGLGWLLAGGNGSVPGASPQAFGHTGFTGTSLWIDPEADRFSVLLSNRVHPDRRRGARLGELRAAFHRAAAGARVG